jgi:competence protein ComEC
VVLTHPHPDHGKGLLYILRRFPVKEFWRGPAENGLTRELDTAARSRGIPIKVLDESAGEFDFGGAGIRVLHPPARARVDPDDLNNLSLVLRVADAGRTLLLTGDVEKETEELLVEKYGPEGSALPGALKADVMSVPHHGSRTSSTAEFLAATAPGWALASAGGHDRGGLPAPEVMQRYASRGVRVKTTDQDGFSAVVMTGDTTLVLTGPEMGEP